MKVMIIILFGLLLSCDSQTRNDKEKQDSQQFETKPPLPVSCYLYANKGDTISLKIFDLGESITGTLVYSLKEKDKNIGKIDGEMKDNLLVADYTFMSEGIQSTREVVFKKAGTSFIEGYGDSFNQNGKTRFKSLDSLTFSSSIRLTGIKCP